MSLHDRTFDYVKPTDKQVEQMAAVREGFVTLAALLQHSLLDGPDKTYVFRLLRTAAMWSHVAITRHQDGAPRE